MEDIFDKRERRGYRDLDLVYIEEERYSGNPLKILGREIKKQP